MSAKQDGVAPRTANDIEQRYNFRRSFAEVMGVASDARKAADSAMKTAEGTYSEFIRFSDSITMNVVGGVGDKASITLKVGDKEYFGELDLEGVLTSNSLSMDVTGGVGNKASIVLKVDEKAVDSGEIDLTDVVTASSLSLDVSGGAGSKASIVLKAGETEVDSGEIDLTDVVTASSLSLEVTGGVGNKASIVLKAGDTELGSGEIDLKGLVTFTNLDEKLGTAGSTVINGSNITTGEILADLIKTGVIKSKDGSVQIDLSNNKVTIDGTRLGYKTQLVLSSSGIKGYGENTAGDMEDVLYIDLGVGGLASAIGNSSMSENNGLHLVSSSGNMQIGSSAAEINLFGSRITIDSPQNDIRISGKKVYWRDMGGVMYLATDG